MMAQHQHQQQHPLQQQHNKGLQALGSDSGGRLPAPRRWSDVGGATPAASTSLLLDQYLELCSAADDTAVAAAALLRQHHAARQPVHGGRALTPSARSGSMPVMLLPSASSTPGAAAEAGASRSSAPSHLLQYHPAQPGSGAAATKHPPPASTSAAVRRHSDGVHGAPHTPAANVGHLSPRQPSSVSGPLLQRSLPNGAHQQQQQQQRRSWSGTGPAAAAAAASSLAAPGLEGRGGLDRGSLERLKQLRLVQQALKPAPAPAAHPPSPAVVTPSTPHHPPHHHLHVAAGGTGSILDSAPRRLAAVHHDGAAQAAWRPAQPPSQHHADSRPASPDPQRVAASALAHAHTTADPPPAQHAEQMLPPGGPWTAPRPGAGLLAPDRAAALLRKASKGPAAATPLSSSSSAAAVRSHATMGVSPTAGLSRHSLRRRPAGTPAAPTQPPHARAGGGGHMPSGAAAAAAPRTPAAGQPQPSLSSHLSGLTAEHILEVLSGLQKMHARRQHPLQQLLHAPASPPQQHWDDDRAPQHSTLTLTPTHQQQQQHHHQQPPTADAHSLAGARPRQQLQAHGTAATLLAAAAAAVSASPGRVSKVRGAARGAARPAAAASLSPPAGARHAAPRQPARAPAAGAANPSGWPVWRQLSEQELQLLRQQEALEREQRDLDRLQQAVHPHGAQQAGDGAAAAAAGEGRAVAPLRGLLLEALDALDAAEALDQHPPGSGVQEGLEQHHMVAPSAWPPAAGQVGAHLPQPGRFAAAGQRQQPHEESGEEGEGALAFAGMLERQALGAAVLAAWREEARHCALSTKRRLQVRFWCCLDSKAVCIQDPSPPRHTCDLSG